MAEYIEREAVLNNQRWNGRFDEYVVFVRDIESIPAADVAPVRHGRWEFDADPYMFCSCCNFSVCADSALDFNYCPNCGALMDKEDDV